MSLPRNLVSAPREGIYRDRIACGGLFDGGMIRAGDGHWSLENSEKVAPFDWDKQLSDGAAYFSPFAPLFSSTSFDLYSLAD